MVFLVCSLVALRLFFWSMFPKFGMDIFSELCFMSIALSFVAIKTTNDTRCSVRFPIIFLTLATLTSLAYSQNPEKSMSFILSFSLYVILFGLIVKYARKNVENVVYFVMALTFLIACRAIFEATLLHQARSYSFLGWHTATSGVMLLTLPLFVLLATNGRWVWKVVLLIIALGFMATKSIFPTISLCIVLVLMFAETQRKRDVCLVIGSSLILGAIVATRGGLFDTFMVRFGYLEDGIKAIAQHPILGSGIATFLKTGVSQTIYVHNSYIQMWAECGIVGFLAICALARAVVMMKPEKTLLERGMYWGLVAFLIDNVANFTLLRFSTSIYFWVLLGCYIAIRRK